MMTKEEARAKIEDVGIIPAVRVHSADDAIFAAETVAEAGIPVAEITMTVPDAVSVIRKLATTAPSLVIGAGSVLNLETARRCLDAGAAFITAPGLDTDIVEHTAKQNVLVLPGVLTPTEITAAIRAGSEWVKVFPCAPLGGPHYLRVLAAPFPHIGLVASGGVDQRTADEYITAGAVALGIGTELVPRRAVQARDTRWIVELARRFLNIVAEARSRIGYSRTLRTNN